MLQSKANANAVGWPPIREVREQIGDRLELDRNGGPGQLGRGRSAGLRSGNGCGHEQDIMLGPKVVQEMLKFLTRLIRDDIRMLREFIMDGRFDRSQQYLHGKASLATCSGQSEAHFAAGTVQDAPNGVQVLQSRPSRDQNSGLVRLWRGHDPLFGAELSLEMDGTGSIDHTHHSATGSQPMKESHGTQAPQTW